MPKGDGTGPEGLGAKTGRAAGYCAGFDQPGFANNRAPRMGLGRRSTNRGRARGFGRGVRGRGRRRNAPRFNASAQSMQQEKEMLKEELDAIENRLSDLEDEDE
ncbi:DUF5320 domain-containing protein [Halanaerobaculum tunisiense]